MKSIFGKFIAIFILVALIPLGISYWIFIEKLKTATKENVINRNLEVASIAAQTVNNYITQAEQVLQSTAEQLSFLDLPQDETSRILKDIFLDFKFYEYIEIYNLDHQLISSSMLDPKPLEHPMSLILEKIKSGHKYQSSIYIKKDPPPLRPSILMAFPMNRFGTIEEVLIAEINLTYATNLTQQIQIGEKGSVTLVDLEGKIFASSELSQLFELKPYKNFSLLQNGKPNQTKNSIVINEKNNDEKLIVYSPLSGTLGGFIVIEQPVKEAFAVAFKMIQNLIYIAATILSLMILISLIGIKWQIINNLKKLMVAIQHIGKGNWDYQVHIKSRDEFSRLGHVFNQMTSQLKDQALKIQQQARLATVGRISSGLVHDLKHPIQNIRNWTRLLPSKYQDDKFRDSFAQIVGREFDNVDIFFKNLKDFTGDMSYNPQKVSVKKLFDSALSHFQLDIEKNPIKLSVLVNPEDLTVNVDSFTMTRVFSNLVSNALGAMPQGGQLSLTAEKQNREGVPSVEIKISDTGFGIDANNLKTIFDDFITTKRKGLGLGLPITKKIIEQHKGKINVSSQKGVGTEFIILLPL